MVGIGCRNPNDALFIYWHFVYLHNHVVNYLAIYMSIYMRKYVHTYLMLCSYRVIGIQLVQEVYTAGRQVEFLAVLPSGFLAVWLVSLQTDKRLP